MTKVECWNCGIEYSYFWRGAICPNCKAEYHDGWIYDIDWIKWAKELSVAAKKLADAMETNNGSTT